MSGIAVSLLLRAWRRGSLRLLGFCCVWHAAFTSLPGQRTLPSTACLLTAKTHTCSCCLCCRYSIYRDDEILGVLTE